MTPFIQCKKQQVPLPSSAGRLSMQHCGTIVSRLERDCFSSSQVRNGVLMAWWSDIRENERCLPAKGSSINTSTQNDTVDRDKEGKKTPTHVLHTTAAPSPESKKVTWTPMYITQLLRLTMMTKDLIFLIILNQSQTATLAQPMASVRDGTICLSCLSRWSVLETGWNQSPFFIFLFSAARIERHKLKTARNKVRIVS